MLNDEGMAKPTYSSPSNVTKLNKEMNTYNYPTPQAGICIVLYAVAPEAEFEHGCKGLGLSGGVRGAFALVRICKDFLYLLVHLKSPMQKEVLLFDIYRYQILPTSKNIQLKIDSNITSVEELVKNKNSIFESILLDRIVLDGRRSRVIHKVDNTFRTIILLRIAAEKGVEIENEDFTTQRVSNYPSLHVAIDNDPKRQYCLIEQNPKAFKDTETVAHILERNLNRYLAKYQLQVFFKPLFNEYDFWDLINQYEGRISRLRFEFIKHNMANIADSIPEGLKRLQEDTNSPKSTLITEAPKTDHLNISNENEIVKGLVDYSKKGGGDIGIKVKGVRYELKTKKKKLKFEVDEGDFNSLEEFTKLMKDIRNLDDDN